MCYLFSCTKKNQSKKYLHKCNRQTSKSYIHCFKGTYPWMRCEKEAMFQCKENPMGVVEEFLSFLRPHDKGQQIVLGC